MSRAAPRLLVICGVARSGTSYVREIVRRSCRCPLVEEPLNVHRGMAGVPVAYPYVGPGGGEYAALVDGIATLTRPWGGRGRRKAGWRAAVGQARGTGARLHWEALRLAGRLGAGPPCLLWKDPFATLATAYLRRRHDARIVCMIRHPGAVTASMRRLGWPFRIDFLRRQPELLAAYGYGIMPRHWEMARSNVAAGIAILWKLMVRINCEASGGDPGLLLIRHEDLCRNPAAAATRILAQFDSDFTPAGRRFVARHSTGGGVGARDGRPHDFLRDSESLTEAWRGEFDPADEAVMRDIIGGDLLHAYERW